MPWLDAVSGLTCETRSQLTPGNACLRLTPAAGALVEVLYQRGSAATVPESSESPPHCGSPESARVPGLSRLRGHPQGTFSAVGGGLPLDQGRLAKGARRVRDERMLPNIAAPRHQVGDTRAPPHS